MADAYICEGNSGKTYGIDSGDVVYIVIEYSNGSLGQVQEMSWPLARWKGQLGAESVSMEEVPEKLQEVL